MAIPFLFSGFLLFSLIGLWYYYHDFLWLIHKLPYGSASNEIYGSGKWYHFLSTMPEYLGFGIILLFIAGTVCWIKDWVLVKFSIRSILSVAYSWGLFLWVSGLAFLCLVARANVAGINSGNGWSYPNCRDFSYGWI